MAIGGAASKRLAINFPWEICMSPCRQRETDGGGGKGTPETAPVKLTIKADAAPLGGRIRRAGLGWRESDSGLFSSLIIS
jgi:hypothetical protein